MQRGPYRIACVMEECRSDESLVLKGSFVDLLDNAYPKVLNLPQILDHYIAHQEQVIIRRTQFDLDKAKEEPVRVIGTSARIFSLEETDTGYTLVCKAADRVNVTMRLKLNNPICSTTAIDETGMQLKVDTVWDEESSTVFLSFPSTNQMTTVYLTK